MFSSTWNAPDRGPLDFKGQKVVALVMTADESVRFGAEEAEEYLERSGAVRRGSSECHDVPYGRG